MKDKKRKIEHTSMLATDPTNAKVNINPELDNVEVRWMFRPDPVGPHEATMESAPGIYRQVRGQYTYNVIVRSEKFIHSKMVGELQMEDGTSIPKMRKKIGILAGALAEELNERFDDNMDPSEVARTAAYAFLEMVNEQKNAFLQNTH